MGNHSHTVIRYLDTHYFALVWVSVPIEPYHPYRIILLFGEGYFCQSVRVEQLPYGIYNILVECLYPVGEIHLQTFRLLLLLQLCVG